MTMDKNENLIRVYTGSEISVGLLKEELEKKGITSMIQNNFQSGVMAGFSGGIPNTADLFIRDTDLQKAAPILKNFENDRKE